MSSSDTETSGNDEKHKSKMIIKKVSELKKLEQQEIFDYIELLHDRLKRNDKNLRKYREKVRSLMEKIESMNAVKEVAVNPAIDMPISDEHSPKNTTIDKYDENDDAAAAAFNFVNEIREVAEQAQHLNGFVYEPTSGLYYDQTSGYYYNAEYGLYYDGNTGCYYNYNKEKNEFAFHSQVAVQPNQTAAKDDDVEFDEWGGVITDTKELQRIKEEKERLREEKVRNKKSKSEKSSTQESHRGKHKKHAKKRKHKHRHRSTSHSDSDGGHRVRVNKRKRYDIEDGELSTSSSSSSSSSNSKNSRRSRSSMSSDNEGDCISRNDEKHDDDTVPIFKKGSRFQDIAKKYPPSLRIIVQDTNLEELKIGSLSLITFKGGSLGREGKHDVIIPDVNVSKYHLKFSYDTKSAIYKCVDLGSRNGTILNGTRMSVSKTESDPYNLIHGSIIQIAQTKLLCHVHEGNSTCGLCEPGLLIESTRETTNTALVASTVVLTHKEQLKKLQRKYGLENEKFVENKQTATNYNDRAATRRIQVGSSTDKEKTQIASINTEISSENKGFKMLSKLGWSKGEALGKTNSSGGLLEPINVASNEGKKGLGCDEPSSGVTLTIADKRKIDTWKKAQERYQKADIFCESEDSN